MKNYLSELTVLRGLLSDPVVRAYGNFLDDERKKSEFLSVLFDKGAEENLSAYFARAVVENENAFSRTCAAGKTPSSYLVKAYTADLAAIGRSLSVSTFEFRIGSAGELIGEWDSATVKRLSAYYCENGYGKFLSNVAFRYDRESMLSPVKYPSRISFGQLKGYEYEKSVVTDNFENFISGLPFCDMLLYGDRGTGKSSTVHAAVNRYSDRKLRLVELAKEDILSLPALRSHLAEIPMKFAVLIDDFSLSDGDDRLSTLKSALQGSMEGHADNVMIVATSNRRHIVEENFSARGNSVHAGDSEQELLSLSDRFGLTVLFTSTGKNDYLAIVRALAEDAELKTPAQSLDALAERWALERGGRSPRRAKQFIDFATACEAKGKPVDF